MKKSEFSYTIENLSYVLFGICNQIHSLRRIGNLFNEYELKDLRYSNLLPQRDDIKPFLLRM